MFFRDYHEFGTKFPFIFVKCYKVNVNKISAKLCCLPNFTSAGKAMGTPMVLPFMRVKTMSLFYLFTLFILKAWRAGFGPRDVVCPCQV